MTGRGRVAIVPARGGSRRVPRKNVAEIDGRPLLSYPIETLRESGLVERVIVSTDDDEIASVALGCGAEVPFRRPAALADDITPTQPVVAHAMEAGRIDADRTDVCVVYPTSVFVTVEDLRRGHELLVGSDSDFVATAVRFAAPIWRALRRDDAGRAQMVWPENRARRTQDLEETFHDAAQFYWGRGRAWQSGAPLFTERTHLLVLPSTRAHDIDTPEDLDVVRAMFAVARARGR